MEIYDPKKHILVPDYINAGCLALAQAQRMIGAVKLLRGYCYATYPPKDTGAAEQVLGLKAAKDYCESLRDKAAAKSAAPHQF